ncbi:hypothetical protein Tco_0183615 [Tanacetum coccineum]
MTGASQREHPGDNIGATPSGIIKGAAGTSIDGGGAGATPGATTPSVTREQIEGYLSALKSLVKEHNSRGNVSPICLNFDDLEDWMEVRAVVTGKEVGDADLRKPFKEAVKTPLTARGWFENLPTGSINGWTELKQQFSTRYSTRRACFKDPTKITRITRKANETLVTFKERWIVETGFIVGLSELMKISSFMDAHKCPELAKRYSDREAFANTELPRGEVLEASKKSVGHVSRREDRFLRGGYEVDRRRNDGRNALNVRDAGNGSRVVKAKPSDQRCKSKRKGNGKGRDNGKDKIINMIRSWPNDRKRKAIECDETWMSAPMSVRRPMSVGRGNVRTLLQKIKPLHEVEAKEYADGFGRFHRGSVRAPSPYNVILRRIGLKTLRAVSSTIHFMVKFPTPGGITTLVTRIMIISKCRRIEKMIDENAHRGVRLEEDGNERVDLTEQVLVNPSYPDPLVTIGGNLSVGCKSQLKTLLKGNLDIFA